ncbi:MAG: hypothetical protein CVV02_01650 [Firmicutes bacterium HGW-Firmicutes-7]|nr:MAG: hypothetical protein CVV02_01650 [Firmicutes bacterium HGW-Firmicutes-7]
MELEKNIMDKFLEYLISHGYPKESIAIEYKIGNKSRVDLAIIDIVTKLPITLFEIKSKKRNEYINMGKNQLERYLRELNINQEIPTYLVFPSQHEPFFEVMEIDTKDPLNPDKIINLRSLDYNLQRRARLTEKTYQAEKDKLKAIDNFSIVCWILAGALLIIGVLSKVFIIEIDTIDMLLLGAFVGLILTPFASKIKFWGIEFERYKTANKE